MSPRKTVLITGCSTGIGNALAREFHERGKWEWLPSRGTSLSPQLSGLVVFATARNEAVLSDLQKAGMTTFALDVTNDEQINRVRDQVAEMTGGKLDILVNNASYSFLYLAAKVRPFPGTILSVGRYRSRHEGGSRSLRCQCIRAMRMVKAFVPLLIASGDACILQVGSVAAVTPYPFGSAYSSSKAALHAYGNTLHVELSPFNIKVVNLCTGSMKSDIVENKLNPLPNHSLYKSLEPIILAKRREVSQGGAISAEQYAKDVVQEALKTSPRAWFVWILDTFLPRTAFDNVMKRWYGLEHISSRSQL
ncbi:NAD-P-binding protein [Desarmillaria tabescens]|uniref:NAD-P-binding protein n=1 Tax=Armillaria tabescens TaxID=1929756 RepID=A0AA39KGA8_ARMTA|nr:NAD-P-binding protein [Desarmillaria tabescens]KAK0459219.1 NAD-P-binding protein [Desarmillaria tabescens]